MSDTPSISTAADRPPIAILGVPFDNVTTAEALALIEQMIRSRRPHYLVTANVDFLVQAQEDEELRRILLDANLTLCDGTPLVWASRWLGNPLTERVAGSDLVPLLIGRAAEKGFRIFLLGATPESAAQAVANLQKLHPKLVLAGQYSPPFNKLLEMEHEDIARRIREAKPDLLLVSFGCPKQEKWIAMHYRSLGVPVSVGVGATIDFLAGQVSRAPMWMRKTGTEWAFRLLQEPRRLFGRYLKDFWVFGRKIFAQWWHLRRRSRKAKPQAPLMTHLEDGWQRVTLPARLDFSAVDGTTLAEDVLIGEKHCLVELGNVRFMDSTGVGFLIRLHKRVKAAGRQLVLLAPSAEVDRVFQLMHLREFFARAANADEARKIIVARAAERDFLVSPLSTGDALSWRGEITAANGEQVWEETRAYLSAFREDRSALVIDLREVRFLDSTGVGVMVRAKKLAQRQAVQLKFINPSPAARNVLKLSQLEEFLIGK